ncbi:MAG: endonuclease/exonuclease/phosphatase family protein [Firmicutes bacterium]|nr:endonuclease/exonuclease/phosphatase family protein [Bacillota bacterium]
MRLFSDAMRRPARVLAIAGIALMLCGLWTCANAQAALPATGSAGSRQRITVMTYNIHAGLGVDFVYSLDRIADLIRAEQADIIGLCEVEQKTQKVNFDDQAKLIAGKLGFYYAYGPIFARNTGFFCNALISRFPILSHRTHQLPNPNRAQPRAALEAQVDVDGTVVTVFVTHLEVADSGSRVAQAEALADIASSTATPRIIMGDFNATPTHAPETALMLREHNDTYALHRVLVDSRWLAAQGPFERDYLKGGYTIGVFDPSARIDYVFASCDVGVATEIGSARVPSSPASDHLPYVVTLELPPKQAGQDLLAASAPDATHGTARSRAAGPVRPLSTSPDSCRPLVKVMQSGDVKAWYEDMGWYYEDDLDMIIEMVAGIGPDGPECALIAADELGGLAAEASERPVLLVLSNVRRMSERQMLAVRDFVAAGGRVLATYQTSLKTETETIAGEYGFGLADLFGAELAGWTGVSPMHDAIAPIGEGELDADAGADALVGAIWEGVKVPVRLRVPEGMVTKPWPGSVVLGQWSGQSVAPSRALPLNAAIVLNGPVMYVGADLLSWDALQEDSARALAANIVRFMLGLDR